MFINAKIETDRLILRPFKEEDAEFIYKMASEPDHFKYQPDTPPTRIEDIQGMIRWSQNCNEKNTREKIYKFNLALVLKDSGEVIGVGGLGPHDIAPEETEIYYALSEQHQGKGYSKEAALAILKYGFKTIGLKKVIATVHPDNIASVRIIEGLGLNRVKVLEGFEGENEGFNGYWLYEKENNEL